MQVRQAKREDTEEISRLTLQMHNHLGRLVGIKFTLDNLEEESLTNPTAWTKSTLQRLMEKLWDTSHSLKRFAKMSGVADI